MNGRHIRGHSQKICEKDTRQFIEHSSGDQELQSTLFLTGERDRLCLDWNARWMLRRVYVKFSIACLTISSTSHKERSSSFAYQSIAHDALFGNIKVSTHASQSCQMVKAPQTGFFIPLEATKNNHLLCPMSRKSRVATLAFPSINIPLSHSSLTSPPRSSQSNLGVGPSVYNNV